MTKIDSLVVIRNTYLRRRFHFPTPCPFSRGLYRVIDRASKRGGGRAGSDSKDLCIAGRSVSDATFFLGAFGVFTLGSLASWGRMYALAMASGGLAARLRTRLFAALMLQEKAFFDSKKAGELAPVLAEVCKLAIILHVSIRA